eukprot:761330-Hanusia_phi.AAC.4
MKHQIIPDEDRKQAFFVSILIQTRINTNPAQHYKPEVKAYHNASFSNPQRSYYKIGFLANSLLKPYELIFKIFI